MSASDDIPIPPPRTRADAKAWYCSSCGEQGEPDLPAALISPDPRYAIGQHDCIRPYRGRRPNVQFIADWAFDAKKWREQKDEQEMQRIHLKAIRGGQLLPAEKKILERYLKREKDGAG